MTQTLDLERCGACGGFFPLASSPGQPGLFSHECVPDAAMVAKLQGPSQAVDPALCSIDAPDHGTGSGGHASASVAPPSEKALGLLTALVRGASFAALTELWLHPELATDPAVQTALDHSDPATFAAAVEAFVPVEVARLSGSPASAIRVSKALDDFKRGDTRPLFRPIVASNFQVAASAPQSPSATPAAAVRANRYAGACASCGGDVGEGEGRLSKSAAGAWIVLHLDGDCVDPTDTAKAWLAKGTVHVVDGAFVRVHIGQTSGFPYAVQARVLVPATWRTEADGTRRLVKAGVVEWERIPGLLKRLSAATVATPAEAAAFGSLAGRCCFCSTPIDTPESTLVGYGPVCAGKYGLPWGDTTQTLEA